MQLDRAEYEYRLKLLYTYYSCCIDEIPPYLIKEYETRQEPFIKIEEFLQRKVASNSNGKKLDLMGRHLSTSNFRAHLIVEVHIPSSYFPKPNLNPIPNPLTTTLTPPNY